MTVTLDYDNGDILAEEVLSISPESIIQSFNDAVRGFAAVSLHTGYIVEPAVAHIIGKAFRDVASVGLASGYKFKEIENAGNAPAPAAAVAAKPAAV